MSFRPALVLAGVFAVATCVPRLPEPAPAVVPKTAPAAVTPSAPLLKAPPPARPDRAAAVRPAEPVPPKLVGLTEAETVDLLGAPEEQAAQPPGKVWIYRSGGCTLSVHFFPDVQKGGFHALDVIAEGGDRDVCLTKVAGGARKE